MKITPGHILMPVLAVVAGAALIYVGVWAGWGAVWAAAGGFFVVVGVSAIVLLLAWIVPGRVGDFLRRPAISILIVVAIIAMLALTVGLGIIGRFR